MRRSIRTQIAVTFFALLTIIFVASWSINNIFLVQYYIANKKEALTYVYDKINHAIEDGTLSSTGMNFGRIKSQNWLELKIELDKAASRDNIMLLGINEEQKRFIERAGGEQMEELELRLKAYMFGQTEEPSDVLQYENRYMIHRYKDLAANAEYIEMIGQFDDGSYFVMQTSMDSILENAQISNRFLAYIGIGVIIIGAAIILYFSKKLSKPILELVGISERMIQLEFEAKYTSGGMNELGTLGRNFNQLSETLEATISELKTANNQLQRDIEQKTQVEEMRKEFLGNVSHELKTPISLIQGYAEGLKEGIADDKESRDFYCDVIVDEAAKMNKMVKNLLSLNQLESEDSVVMERFDIVALIRAVLQSNEIIIQQKEAKIVFQTEEPVFVWADEFRVEEVVTNYISNALHHLDGEKIIEIRIIRQGDSVRVLVFNTGAPIPEEDINKVWEKFYKVDKARTREYGGNGIGLSIVKAIMESLHKECGVTNYANGVEFWFELDSKL